MDSLNKAKRRVKKNLKKGSKNEVPYAGTIETQQEYDTFVDALGSINAEMFDVATGVVVDNSQANRGSIKEIKFKFSGVVEKTQLLLRKTFGLDFSVFSPVQLDQINNYVTEISNNNETLQNTISTAPAAAANTVSLGKVVELVGRLVTLIQTKISQINAPTGSVPIDVNPIVGNGYLLPRHVL